MIKIRQHGENKELYDIANFLYDLDKFFKIQTWHIIIDWCSGERAKEIEEMSKDGIELSDEDFRELYKGIYQTIDGKFTINCTNEHKIQINAVDSTFWEIDTKNKEFENHMIKKYGLYTKYPSQSS